MPGPTHESLAHPPEATVWPAAVDPPYHIQAHSDRDLLMSTPPTITTLTAPLSVHSATGTASPVTLRGRWSTVLEPGQTADSVPDAPRK